MNDSKPPLENAEKPVNSPWSATGIIAGWTCGGGFLAAGTTYSFLLYATRDLKAGFVLGQTNVGLGPLLVIWGGFLLTFLMGVIGALSGALIGTVIYYKRRKP